MGHSFILLENDVGRVTAYVRFNQSAQYFVEMKKNMIAMSKNMLELHPFGILNHEEIT